jgi:hypothetical protein
VLNAQICISRISCNPWRTLPCKVHATSGTCLIWPWIEATSQSHLFILRIEYARISSNVYPMELVDLVESSVFLRATYATLVVLSNRACVFAWYWPIEHNHSITGAAHCGFETCAFSSGGNERRSHSSYRPSWARRVPAYNNHTVESHRSARLIWPPSVNKVPMTHRASAIAKYVCSYVLIVMYTCMYTLWSCHCYPSSFKNVGQSLRHCKHLCYGNNNLNRPALGGDPLTLLPYYSM